MDKKRLNEIKKKINKLKVTSYKETEVISDSNFLKIVRGNYCLFNNKEIVRESVTANMDNKDASCIFALDKDNNILVVIQPRVVIDNDTKVNIEVPAGYIEEGEDKKVAALRELREETGYTTNNIVLLDSYYPSIGGSVQKIYLFLAINCEKKYKQKLDKDEYIEFEKLSIDEFMYLINNNYIHDINTRLGFYKVLEYLENYKMKNIVNKLIKNNKTISTMESCTGGFIASSITNIENSSKVLKYSAVTYSNEYKIKMGVASKVIDKYSVYSIECAKEMAYNISKYSNSNYGLGITGTLKKYDENNITKDNDIVYISIYDRDFNKYYNYKYKVYCNERINNKRSILLNIILNLEKIIK